LSVFDLLTAALLVVGAVFFAAGTCGLLRFPDTFSRLHALTKADNLGLGFLVAGLVLQAGSMVAAAKLVLIWLIAIVASTSASYLLARHALQLSEDRAFEDRAFEDREAWP
jgi:multicomponent Na+:H+ antiporter subunit G